MQKNANKCHINYLLVQRKEYLGKILKIFVLPTCVFHQNISIQVFKVTLYRCKQGGGENLRKKIALHAKFCMIHMLVFFALP